MAFAYLKDSLTCSVCSNFFEDPITLSCGHSLCQLCATSTLDDQKEHLWCRGCNEKILIGKELKRNLRLFNIMEHFQSSQREQEDGIACTWCIDNFSPAVKTCLLCEASLCEDHLKVHSKLAEHVLTEPTTSLGNRRCSVHKKVLEYYCCEDTACICVSCRLDGEHRGHQVETLNEASEKKKEKLRKILQKLTSQREEVEENIRILEEQKSHMEGKAVKATQQMKALIRDISDQLEALDKRVLSEISRQEEQVSLRVSDLIRQLEIKKEELSRKMGDIEKLCDTTDPVTVLQEQESDRDDYCDAEEGDKVDVNKESDALKVYTWDLDGDMIINTGLVDFVTHLRKHLKTFQNFNTSSEIFIDINTASNALLDVKTSSGRLLDVYNALEVLMDIKTASNDILVMNDLKMITGSKQKLKYIERPERFQHPQVLSTKSVSAGKYYCDVETSEPGQWRLGVSYTSIERQGSMSWFGNNEKSWCLGRQNDQYLVRHNNSTIQLLHRPLTHKIRLCINFEGGQVTFFEQCDSVRLLHTFAAVFTEPLHVAFAIFDNTWLRVSS